MTGRNEPLPLIVTQPFGKGNVLYVGFDETWRWRMVRDSQFHRRFWANCVRYLATLQARRLIITTGGSKFGVGEMITVEAEAYDESYRPLEQEALELQMTDLATGTRLRTITLKAAGKDKPGHYKASFVAEHRGQYELSAPQVQADPNDAVTAKQIAIELPQAEFARTEADVATMKSLAWPPEKVLDLGQIDQLNEIPSGRWTSTHEVPKFLWDTKLMLLVIVALLVTEWILRKKYHMA